MPALYDRLVNDLKSKGNKDPYALAKSILEKNGYLKQDGTLTEKGKIKERLPPGTKGLGDKKDIAKNIRAGLWKTK